MVVSDSELEVEVYVEVSNVVGLVNGGSVIEMISESSDESVVECSLAVDRVVEPTGFVDGLGIIGGEDVSMTNVVGNVLIALDVSGREVVLVVTEGKVTTPPVGAKTNVAVMVR